MHEPKLIPGKGAGAVAQNMPIRAVIDTVILPPAIVPRYNANGGAPLDLKASIPENHALVILCDAAFVLTLSNPGDKTINLPFPAGIRRIIPIRQIGEVSVTTTGKVAWWIEDMRAMEPWICEGEYRP